jgi:hypothetical protein
VKANGYRVAGAQVSESGVGNRRGVCYCGSDAVPCAPLFRLSSPLSPLCVPLCVVAVRPSPLPLLPRRGSHVHSPLLGEGLKLHWHPYLVCLTTIPS